MHPLREIFDDFVRAQEQRLGVELRTDRRRTHFLGGWGITNQNVTDRVILVGDAAGWVDPMMGEGIAYAMKSGVIAAGVVLKAFASDEFDEKSLSSYQDLCTGEFGAGFGMAGWAGSRGVEFAERLLTHASGDPLAADLLAMLARGEIDYAGIPAVIIRSLPRVLPRVLKRAIRSHLA